MQTVKAFLFLAILGYAAVVDIKWQLVPTHIHILLIITGIISVSAASFWGAAVAFIPFFIIALLCPEQIGGGDVKLAASCGFVLGGADGLLGLSVGLLFAVILVPLWRRLKRKTNDTSFPLVPFLFVGFALYILILKGISL